jgi:Flp pilus assembly pilin Flp
MMATWAAGFWADDTGQDLVEYTLILAIFALMTMGLVGGQGPSVNRIWTSMTSHLNEGSTVAAGS